MALRENNESDPYDGVMIMLASPVDGGPTLPTIAWQAQLLSKKQKTLAHRHNSTTFYFAFEGRRRGRHRRRTVGIRQRRYLRRARLDAGTIMKTPVTTTRFSSPSTIGRR